VTVVDASVAFKWLLDEEGSDRADDLAGSEPLSAPSLLRAEVGNALLKKVLRGEITDSAAQAAHGAIGSFISDWEEMAALADDAFAIAIELSHPIYDCYYLALAQIREVGLITADLRLLEVCRGTRFEGQVIRL
jgi:predicted nucleic acid-binding protein